MTLATWCRTARILENGNRFSCSPAQVANTRSNSGIGHIKTLGDHVLAAHKPPAATVAHHSGLKTSGQPIASRSQSFISTIKTADHSHEAVVHVAVSDERRIYSRFLQLSRIDFAFIAQNVILCVDDICRR